MASENGSETQDEKAALIQASSEEETQQQGGTELCNNDSKLTLYHWTQSFNSQKVSRCHQASAPNVSGQLPGIDLTAAAMKLEQRGSKLFLKYY